MTRWGLPYTQVTLAQFRSQLAARLGDTAAASGSSYWASAELDLYIQEAIRTWQCAANYFSGRGVFTTTARTAFYDLNAELPNELGNVLTDADTIKVIEYQLLEPATPTVWTGTEQFTLDDLTLALQRRRNQFLEETGIYIGLPADIAVSPSDDGIVQLDENVLRQRRVAWRSALTNGTGNMLFGTFSVDSLTFTVTDADIDRTITIAGAGTAGGTLTTQIVSITSSTEVVVADAASASVVSAAVTMLGNFTQLPRTDSFALNAQLSGWSTDAATPEFYIPYYATPQTKIQLAPVPIDLGSVQVLSVNAGADLDPTAGVAMGLNDDYVPYIKWGALADLLNMEGMANDSQRAQYCEQRYREGVELAKITFTVTQAKVNGVPVPLMALDDFDFQIAGWQNDLGQPTDVAAGNSNIIALSPVPDGVYSLELDVLQNAIVPMADNEYIQIERGFLDAILGMAVHIACFKLGGQEFSQTMPLYEQFMRCASTCNSKLAANLSNFDIFNEGGTRETMLRPAIAA